MIHRWTKDVSTALCDSISNSFPWASCCWARWGLVKSLGLSGLKENELATLILNESWNNCFDLLQISLHSFDRAVILKVKMSTLTFSFNCVPSDQSLWRKRGCWCTQVCMMARTTENAQLSASLPALSELFLHLRASSELLWARLPWVCLPWLNLFTITYWSCQDFC